MKTKIKLAIGVVFAAVAIVSATGPDYPVDPPTKPTSGPCYTEVEIQLLMNANHWNHQQAEDILKLACSYSNQTNP